MSFHCQYVCGTRNVFFSPEYKQKHYQICSHLPVQYLRLLFRLGHLPLKRLDQSTNVFLDFNLINGNCLHFTRFLANRWQVVRYQSRNCQDRLESDPLDYQSRWKAFPFSFLLS